MASVPSIVTVVVEGGDGFGGGGGAEDMLRVG